MVSVDEFIRGFPERVVAAWQHHDIVINSLPLNTANYFARELRQEGGVVGGVNELGFLGPASVLFHVVNGTDSVPHVAKAFEIELLLDTLANMLCRQSGPHNIG